MDATRIEDCRVNCYFFEFGKISRQVTCRYYGVKGECPCKTCRLYISSNEVDNIARNVAKKRDGGVIA